MDYFEGRKNKTITVLGADKVLPDSATQWVDSSLHAYSYHFTWLGRPIIQYPQDIVAAQEVRPQWTAESGLAHGGSFKHSASMPQHIDAEGVVGFDIDIRAHQHAEDRQV
ncbi:MAG: hypothetical protein J0L73_06805 [Verrucomicrobia bacterium]|nr:hypothetical protein [Verrucomicrobiota bacterium]